MTLYKDIMTYLKSKYLYLWLESDYILVSLEKEDALKVYRTLPILGNHLLNPV